MPYPLSILIYLELCLLSIHNGQHTCEFSEDI